MSTKFVGTNTLYLAGSGTTIGATSIVLTSLSDIYGNVLTMADFGSKGYITIEPDTVNAEFATFTGIIANTNGTFTLTGVSTALAKSPYTETSGLIRQHAGGTKLVVTDNVEFWNTFLNLGDNGTVTGTITFATGATPTITDAPVNATDAANKAYVDNVAISGGANASSTVKGITKLSLDPVAPTNPIAVGDNDTRVPTQGENDALVGNNTDVAVGSGNKFVTQTGLIHGTEVFAVDTSGSSTAYTAVLSPVPTSLTDGMVIRVKIGLANTTTTPTLAVNGLTAHTIVKETSTALVVGDITAGKYCEFQYDLTNTQWILLNPSITNTINSIPVLLNPQTIGLGNQSVNIICDVNGFSSSNSMVAVRGTGALANAANVLTQQYSSLLVSSLGTSHVSSGGSGTGVVIGNYVYIGGFDGSNPRLYRYDKGTMANDTLMTMSGGSYGGGAVNMFTDGTYIYFFTAGTTFQKYSISGTTATYTGVDISLTSFPLSGVFTGMWSDGSHVYLYYNSTIYKWAVSGGAATQITTYTITNSVYPATNQQVSGIIGYNGNTRMLIFNVSTSGQTTITIIPYQ